MDANIYKVENRINQLKEKILTDDQVKVFTEQALIVRFGKDSKELELIDRSKLLQTKRIEYTVIIFIDYKLFGMFSTKSLISSLTRR